ncbi:MAG: ribonuclease HI [Flavisolibacter sp.]
MAEILIYTDGSCNTTTKRGAWVALILYGAEKKYLTGMQTNTTNNRMELTAAIEAVNYALKIYGLETRITIFSDSQYLVGLPLRLKKLLENNFKSSGGNIIPNVDLLKSLVYIIENCSCTLVKVKAHAKNSHAVNYNREVDKIARQLVRNFNAGII